MEQPMIDVDTHAHLTRQLDLIPVDRLGVPVTIIGCGAIGSFTAIALAKMGVTNLTLFDHDTVSIENMSNQFFSFSDIDAYKAEALQGSIKRYTGSDVAAYTFKYDSSYIGKTQGIVIIAVDSMEARKEIYSWIKDQGYRVDYIIDPRMGAETYLQYTLKPHNERHQGWYEKTLYSDSEAVQERCTAKSTIYTAMLAAGLLAKTVKNIITGQKYPMSVQWDIAASTNPMSMFENKDEVVNE